MEKLPSSKCHKFKKPFLFIFLAFFENQAGGTYNNHPFPIICFLLSKEFRNFPPDSKNLFFLSPMTTFVLSIFVLISLPFSSYEIFFDFDFGLILIFGVSSLGIYGIVLSGWSSNSRYSFLGLSYG